MSRRYAQIETSKVFSKQHSMLFCLARTVSALYARTATKAAVSLTVAARAGGEMNSPCDVNYFRLTQISPWGGFACKRKQFENLTKEMLTSTQPARLHFTRHWHSRNKLLNSWRISQPRSGYFTHTYVCISRGQSQHYTCSHVVFTNSIAGTISSPVVPSSTNTASGS